MHESLSLIRARSARTSQAIGHGCTGARLACRLLFEAIDQPDQEAEQGLRTLAERALERIAAVCRDPATTVAALAAGLSVDRSHLSRSCQRAFRCPPQELLLRSRLQLAEQALRTGSDPIAAVAHACGFADADYFSRQFRRRHGCTPKAYRQRLQHGTADRGPLPS